MSKASIGNIVYYDTGKGVVPAVVTGIDDDNVASLAVLTATEEGVGLGEGEGCWSPTAPAPADDESDEPKKSSRPSRKKS